MTVFISPVSTILEPVKIGKVNTKTYVAKTVPASYTLPLQTVPDPLAHVCRVFCVYDYEL